MNSRILLVTASLVLIAGCAPYPYNTRYDRDYSRDRYADRDDRRVCSNCGELTEIEPVRLRERSTGGGGAVLGAIIGGVLGSTIGHGDGRRAATVAGAVAGGFAGNAVERDGSDGYAREAWLLTIRLDDGRWAEVTQSHREGLRRGDRVAIRNDRVELIR